MTLTLRYAARSDRGLIRSGNQDSVYAGPRLLAVADGMGGMAAGDVASNIVIATMAPLDEDVPGNAMIDTLRGAVDLANQQIRDAVEENPSMEGMGTTLTAMLFSGSKMGMIHIGDSRAYLVRDGEFAQVTKDDTYVQMLVDEGRISLEEANSHPQRSLLTRALDGRDADPEYSVRQVKTGDRYLLCSDGLSGVVSAETIESTLREYVDPNQCAGRLIELALRGGGPDNITVIVADVTDEDIVEERPIVGGAAAQDRGMATSADQSMSSARGAALSAPRPPVPEDDAALRGAGASNRDRLGAALPAPPAAHRHPPRGPARAARRRALVRLERHPVPLLRRRHRRRPGGDLQGRARQGRVAAPVRGVPGERHAHAGRPDAGRAGQRQAGHRGRQSAEGAGHDDRPGGPEQPGAQAGVPDGTTFGPATASVPVSGSASGAPVNGPASPPSATVETTPTSTPTPTPAASC